MYNLISMQSLQERHRQNIYDITHWKLPWRREQKNKMWQMGFCYWQEGFSLQTWTSSSLWKWMPFQRQSLLRARFLAMTVEKSLQMSKKQKNTCLKLIVNQINVTNVKKSLVKGWIVKRLGLGLGTWDLGPGNRIENRESRNENRESRNLNWESRNKNRESKLRPVPVSK